ncbi:MAG TPA: tetratricopeptide repeat protein, partial [Stellaceae bacterium]|nr:tetratricopeptide repeat protein [Stellaceae bacterium]
MAEVEAILAEALEHHQAKRFVEAEALYREAWARSPHHASIPYQLARIASHRGEHDRAAALAAQALALDGTVSEFHRFLGQESRSLGYYHRAALSYLRALQLAPQNVAAHSGLGDVCLLQGKLRGAIYCYRRALALRPDHLPVIANFGLAL